jgi:formylmethanofuran dehydrogenase subunit A
LDGRLLAVVASAVAAAVLVARYAHEEIENLNLSAKQLLELIHKQWLADVRFLPASYVEACKAEFVEWALCDYLVNLARMTLKGSGKHEVGLV